MVLENKYGQILHFIKDNGKITFQMDMEGKSILMEMYMKVFGKMELDKAKEPIKLLMGIAIVENGIMIIDMDKALKKLLIALNMKGNLIH